MRDDNREEIEEKKDLIMDMDKRPSDEQDPAGKSFEKYFGTLSSYFQKLVKSPKIKVKSNNNPLVKHVREEVIQEKRSNSAKKSQSAQNKVKFPLHSFQASEMQFESPFQICRVSQESRQKPKSAIIIDTEAFEKSQADNLMKESVTPFFEFAIEEIKKLTTDKLYIQLFEINNRKQENF